MIAMELSAPTLLSSSHPWFRGKPREKSTLKKSIIAFTTTMCDGALKAESFPGSGQPRRKVGIFAGFREQPMSNQRKRELPKGLA